MSEHAASRTPRGFTLLEMVVAMTVVAIISGVVTPVLLSATDAYAASRELRRVSDDAAFAMATVTRIIREAPPGTSTRLGVASADAGSLLFTDGSGIRVTDGTLEMLTPDGSAPVARGVTDFAIEYLDADGITACAAADVHRVHVSMTVRGFPVAAAAFPRVNAGEEP